MYEYEKHCYGTFTDRKGSTHYEKYVRRKRKKRQLVAGRAVVVGNT